MKGKSYPTWKFRYFRLRAVDHCGYDDWYFGVSWHPRGNFTHGRREVEISIGHRDYIFDLGPSKSGAPT